MGIIWGWLIGDKGDVVDNSVQKGVYVDEKCRENTQNKEVEAEFEQFDWFEKASKHAWSKQICLVFDNILATRTIQFWYEKNIYFEKDPY